VSLCKGHNARELSLPQGDSRAASGKWQMGMLWANGNVPKF
jgi:hypothetical protein